MGLFLILNSYIIINKLDNKNIMKLTEENVEIKIKKLLAENNWLNTYKVLKEESLTGKYDSMEANLNPLFVYNMIKNKVTKEQFTEIVEYIYEKETREDLTKLFDRFFNLRDMSSNLLEYSKINKYDNRENIWDNVGYVFLTLDMDAEVGKKVKFDKETLPYLEITLEKITIEKVYGVYMGYFHNYIERLFVRNIEELEPLIKIAQSNPALQVIELKEHNNFLGNLLRSIGNASYEDMDMEEVKVIYKDLEKYVPNIDTEIAKALLKERSFKTKYDSSDAIDIELAILNFCLKGEIDIIPAMHEKYVELYTKRKTNESEKKKKEAYREVIRMFSSSIDISFSQYNFNIDCSKIDISKEPIENFVYIKAIEEKIKRNDSFVMSKELISYLQNILNTHEEDQMYGFKYEFEHELMNTYLSKYENYTQLNEILPIKNNSTSKQKKIKV